MGIQLPRLTRCCFCFSLRVGSLIIGYICIISAIVFISMISYVLYKVVIYVEENKNRPNPQHPPNELAQAALGLYVSQAYYLLVYTYLLIINIVMVIGVHLSKPKLVKIYVFNGFFLLGLELALIVVSVIFVGILTTLPLFAWCLIHFFCLLVVRSTQLDMEDQNKPRVYEMQTMYPPQQAPLMM